MRNDRLFDAIGLVDEDLIWEAEHVVPEAPKPVFAWKRWAGAAAAAVVVLAVGLTIHGQQMGKKSADMSTAEASIEYSSEAEEAAAEEMEGYSKNKATLDDMTAKGAEDGAIPEAAPAEEAPEAAKEETAVEVVTLSTDEAGDLHFTFVEGEPEKVTVSYRPEADDETEKWIPVRVEKDRLMIQNLTLPGTFRFEAVWKNGQQTTDYAYYEGGE